jgi:hypothetical protein
VFVGVVETTRKTIVASKALSAPHEEGMEQPTVHLEEA